jgi:hypothetical protein
MDAWLVARRLRLFARTKGFSSCVREYWRLEVV